MSKPLLTVNAAHRWLPLVRKMLEHYRNPWSYMGKCIFCIKTGWNPGIGMDACKKCLWMKFEKMKCTKKMKALDGVETYFINADNFRNHAKPRWTAASIKRLMRWERRLKEIIARSTK